MLKLTFQMKLSRVVSFQIGPLVATLIKLCLIIKLHVIHGVGLKNGVCIGPLLTIAPISKMQLVILGIITEELL